MASELSYHDKKVIAEAADFITLEEKAVKESIEEFADKGSFGLWLDAKGFWNVSDQQTVLNNMENYGEIHKGIIACFQSVEENDGNAYQRIIDLYKKIEELKRDADIHANGKSKALCTLAKNFLDNQWKLDHNLKRVECVVLVKEINRTKEIADNLNQKLDQAITSFETLQGDNLNLKNSVDELHEENLDLKNTMRKLLRENQGLKDMISDANERADQRLREMVEENRRNMQQMMIKMQENKTGSKKTKDNNETGSE